MPAERKSLAVQPLGAKRHSSRPTFTKRLWNNLPIFDVGHVPAPNDHAL